MMLREQQKKLNSLLYLLYEAPKLALTSEVQQQDIQALRYRIINN